MKQFLLKRIFVVFLLTGSWLFAPIYFIVHPKIEANYDSLSKKLTPYSVDVRGYYRSDGTYVRPHSRRPPGSVKRDKPIKSEMSKVSTTMFIVSAGFYGSLAALLIGSIDTIKLHEKDYHKFLFNKVIDQIKLDFTYLKNKPSNLINRKISRYNRYSKIYDCIRCDEHIGQYEFNWSNLAKRKPQKICLNCMQSEKSERFTEGLMYVYEYQKSIEKFVSIFNELCFAIDEKYVFEEHEIEGYFNKKLIESRT